MGGPGSGRWPKKAPGTHLGARSKAQQERDRAELQKSRRDHAPVGVPQPEPNKDWLPLVQAWWRALGASDIAKVAQPADWMTAWIAADVLDQMYEHGFTAGLFHEWTSIVSTLHAPRFDLLEQTSAEPEVDEDEEAAEAHMDGLMLRLVEGNE